MPHEPVLATVVGSYPIPGWLEFAGSHVEAFGPRDLDELWDDAVTVAVMDQVRAGLTVITDGEQTRTDFNLSFYTFLSGVELNRIAPRRFGPALAAPGAGGLPAEGERAGPVYAGRPAGPE
jgi:5-methyltetrahydropteroyltriglutamate--homocysteine methyltransferase